MRTPGDRSITVRAALIGAIADGESIVRGYLISDDTTACLKAVRALGVAIHDEGDTLRITGVGLRGLRAAAQPLHCDSSGATLRLLAGLMSGQSFASTLDGSAQLRKRPMRRVTEPLARMGARIADADGCAPLQIEPAQLRGIDYAMPIASAQVKSAVLLAALYAGGETTVREPATTRDHTERMLGAAGVSIRRQTTDDRQQTAVVCRPPATVQPLRMSVPADFSSAAFFLVAGVLHPGAAVRLEGVGVNPTRTGLLDALEAMGARVERRLPRDEGGEPVADLLPEPGDLAAIDVGGDLAARMIDEFPVFAVAATQAKGRTVVRDAQELRVKESDRIDGLVEELRKMGARIEPTPDGFVVDGPARLRGAVVDGRGDHRMAMALAVAALVADGETTIAGAECVRKTYPEFFTHLARLF